ncbi:MAG: DUF488 family protein [Peptococcaceae bacterium]|nr:DUF488 family protein [Peptococcaceae bacterium]
MLKIKRIYEPPAPEDGSRLLVDRLWPRGLARERAAVDEWRKDLAPSHELRKWYNHEPDRWEEFSRRYREELIEAGMDGELADLARRASRENVTLVYAARDPAFSHALALERFIAGAGKPAAGPETPR